MSKRVYVVEDLCNGCRSCELACSFALSREFNPQKALIKITKVYSQGLDIPLVSCNQQCKSQPPKCVEICPTGALFYATVEEARRMRRDLAKNRSIQPVFKVIAPWKYPFPWKKWPFAKSNE
jgi:Fe-S-cluster-containing dehydrogenase component